MITIGEFLRWVLYRTRSLYFQFLRRVMRGDRLLWGSENKFRALLEAAPDAMVIVDSHGHIALVNEQAERLFGYRRKELVGKGISGLIPKRLRPQHRHHVKGYQHDAAARPMGSGLELHGLRKDGTEFPVEISLSPIETDEGMMVSSAIRDITTRKRELTELRTAEELFRGAFDGSPIGMAMADGEGYVVRVNQALCELTGRSARDLAGQRFDTLTHDADADHERKVVGALLSVSATSTRSRRAFGTPAARRSGSRCRRRRSPTRRARHAASSSRCRTSRTAATTRRTCTTLRRTTR